jgi:membrane protein implicated in regulation of membrane protease activity
MAILLVVLAAAAALAASLLTQLIWPAWAALALCVAGLGLIVARAVVRKRRHGKENRAADADGTADEDAADEDTAVENAAVEDTVDENTALDEDPAEDSEVVAVPSIPDTTGPEQAVPEQAEPEEPEPADLVRVAKGRRRFHGAGCRVLASHEFDELTREEAEDEGFTACTVCAGIAFAAASANGTAVPVPS